MKSENKSAFKAVLLATFEAIGRKTPGNDAIKIWWAVFEPHEFNDVRKAFSTALAQSAGFITPAEIAKHLPANALWIGADEAWATFPKDEADTQAVTNAALEAWGVCSGIYIDGDKIAARVAFKDAYTRVVERERANNNPPLYSITLGHDKERREIAITEAFRKGLINDSQALKHLPRLAVDHNAKLLVDVDASTMPESHNKTELENLRRIKQMIAESVSVSSVNREADRLERVKAMEEKRAAMILDGKEWQAKHLSKDGEKIARERLNNDK